MENSKIEWTDHTWNPWEGCTQISPGCAHCYAATRNARWNGTAINWGKGAPRRRTSPANWRKPLAWNRETGLNPAAPRPKVFCASLADWLDDEVPVEWLADLLAVIYATPHLDWLLLTKRPENWMPRLLAAFEHLQGLPLRGWVESWLAATSSPMAGVAPANVWIGTTTEDQVRADARIPHLLAIPAAVRFLSVEPMVGPVDLAYTCFNASDSFGTMPGIHWVICGGESGREARPMHPDWARSLRDQCQRAGTAFFFKQWGEWRDGVRLGKGQAGRLLDGQLHNAFPIPDAAATI